MKRQYFFNLIISFLLLFFLMSETAFCASIDEEPIITDRIIYIPDGYYKISNKSSNKTIEIRDSFFSKNADVIIDDFVNDNNQIFYLKALSDKSYSISPAHSNLFIGVNPENEKINQDTWKDSDSQKFFLEIDYDTGFFRIISKETSKALTVDNIITGTLVYEEQNVNIEYQLWSFDRVEKNKLNYNYFEDGLYKIANLETHKVFVIKDFNFGPSPVLESVWNGENNQIFRIERLDDGNYSIKTVHSNMYLSIEEKGKLIVKPWDDLESQKFTIDNYSADEYIVRSKLTGKSIGITSNDDINKIDDENKNEDSIYYLGEVLKNDRNYPEKGFIDSGFYRITNTLSNKNLEIKDFSLENGSTLIQTDLKNVNSQIFYFEHLGENKYAIKLAHSLKSLQVSQNVDDLLIIQWDFLNNENQKFYVEPYGDGFIIRSCSTNKLITVLDEKVIEQDQCKDGAQIFKITEAARNEFNTANGEPLPPPPPPTPPPPTPPPEPVIIAPPAPPIPTSHLLNVPLVNQRPELPTGCEITAVTMMLLYSGANVNKVALAKEMPRSSGNPNSGYVGNPFLNSGWTIYPPALLPLVRKYAGNCMDLTGCSQEILESQVLNNKPVVLWLSGMYGFGVHAVTLTGFDGVNYYFNDPWANKKNMPMKRSTLLQKWGGQRRRALSY
ncbi:MAG: RICIN domain-containing protein [Oscillospiraceae bacterium]|nr:RICIN domain-containing protein [Oscillospiraceae bacterium]